MNPFGGMVEGAEAGSSMMGPIGALAGAGIGAGGSLIDSAQKRKQQKKAEAMSRPKRRKLSQVQASVEDAQRTKMASMATLSQAAMEWAQMIR